MQCMAREEVPAEASHEEQDQMDHHQSCLRRPVCGWGCGYRTGNQPRYQEQSQQV